MRYTVTYKINNRKEEIDCNANSVSEALDKVWAWGQRVYGCDLVDLAVTKVQDWIAEAQSQHTLVYETEQGFITVQDRVWISCDGELVRTEFEIGENRHRYISRLKTGEIIENSLNS